MNETQMKRIVSHLAEDLVPAKEVDLWPRIQAKLAANKAYQRKGFFFSVPDTSQTIAGNMSIFHLQQRRLRIAAVVLITLILPAFFLFATPQGRVLAQTIFHFFIKTQSDVIPGPTQAPFAWVEQTRGVPAPTLTPWPTPVGPEFEALCGSYSSPMCSVEEIRNRVSFPVYQLAEIPERWIFIGATGGPNGIQMVYMANDQSAYLTLSEEPWSGSLDQKPWQVGASAEIQTVKMGEVTAEYVKGAYDGNQNPPVWNSALNVQNIRWIDHGILFTLMLSSGKEPNMGMSDLVALAENLTDKPVAAVTSMPTAEPTSDPLNYLKERFSLSINQAEQQAGFALHLPKRLPEMLTLLGALYEPDRKDVVIFYWYNVYGWGGRTDGLSVVEQPISQSGDCPLCSAFIVGKGDRKDIPENLVGGNIETVKIGNASGQYVEGVWSSWEDCCGWHWDADPYLKRLRWQANGMAYELEYMGTSITKEDLIAIAQSIP